MSERKIYELELPPNCPGTLWIKEGKAYHTQDPTNLYPYDALSVKLKYSKENILTREEEYCYSSEHLQYHLYLSNLSSVGNANLFVQDYIEQISSPLFVQIENNKKNVIVGWRKYQDRIIVGIIELEAITDTIYTGKFCHPAPELEVKCCNTAVTKRCTICLNFIE